MWNVMPFHIYLSIIISACLYMESFGFTNHCKNIITKDWLRRHTALKLEKYSVDYPGDFELTKNGRFRWEYRFESALVTLLNTKYICQEKPVHMDWQGNRYYLTDLGRVRGLL